MSIKKNKLHIDSMVIVSAPAKVHLIGEHAVVYGHPAIIAAVGLRVYVEAEKSDKVILTDSRFKGRRHEWTPTECRDAVRYAEDLWRQCAEKKNFSELLSWAKGDGSYTMYWKALIGTALKMVDADGGIKINVVKCDIPTGSGLGSSSAAAVAIAKAAAEVYGRNLDLEKINEIAYECEKLVHGTPSGGDNSACCFGSLLWFQKAQPKNIIKTLGHEVPHKLENFVLVFTKQPEKSTGELIQIVRNITDHEKKPKMEEIEKMTHEMLGALKKKDYFHMKKIMNRTNEILTSFGLSTPETETIAKKVLELGGAAKMCGACGGGVMLVWHEHPEKIISAVKELGFRPLEADLAVEGVRAEN